MVRAEASLPAVRSRPREISGTAPAGGKGGGPAAPVWKGWGNHLAWRKTVRISHDKNQRFRAKGQFMLPVDFKGNLMCLKFEGCDFQLGR